MKTRPSLVPGAICKWSRKARYNFKHYPSATLIALESWDSAIGSGKDKIRMMINTGAMTHCSTVRRSNIWFTGKVGNVPVTKKGLMAPSLGATNEEVCAPWLHKATFGLSKSREQVWVCSCQADTPVGFPCWKCGAEERK